MEIPENGVFRPHSAEEKSADAPIQSNPTEASGTDSNDGRTDAVRLTEKGLAFNNAASHARALPETRLDRVMELKRQLAQGTYQVIGERIAVNMIDESLENDKVLKQIDTNV
jgi:flagellar biosynthesis anti-sigma factor FlgM